jgi:ribosomal protein S12 methylthiotransferase accessory factor
LTLLARAEAQHARQYVIDRAGRVSEHVILALPSCARCARVARLADPLPLEAAVSARVGLVHETYDVAPADALLPTVCVRGCRSDAFHATRALNGGIAADVSRERARVRAIAESLERYCLAFVNRAIRVATAEALGEPWITPAGFPLEQEISWTRAHRIVDGAAVWVPAAAVFLPLDAGVWGDRGWIQTSNGTAAGPTLEAALRSALLEMEERDTFIRAWRANAVPAKCAVQAMVPGMHLACVPSAWGPPVVAAFLEQPMPPLSAAGLACRLDLEDAVQAAQLEAVAAHALFTEQIRAGVTIPEGPPRQLVHHGLAHALRPELRAARASWLAPRGSYVPGPSRPLEQACVIDLTTPDVAAFGVHVVRVVRPDRLGLDHDATRPALSGNPDPHPIS